MSDADRIIIDEKNRARKKETHRINRAKYRNSPKGKKKEREYEQSEKRKEARVLLKTNDDYKAKQKEYKES